MLTLDPRLVTADQLQALRAQGVDTVCHVNAGTIAETDPGFSDLPPAVIGSAHKTRPNERYLDIRRVQMVVPVITQQIVACKNQGFTAIEPDGLDAYAQDSNFPLTAADTVHYATTLAHVAHGLGLRIAQKNIPELTEALLPHFDFAITESCFETGTCEQIAAYPKANKPAFNAEYTDADIDFAKACAEGARLNINMIRKDRPVTAPVAGLVTSAVRSDVPTNGLPSPTTSAFEISGSWRMISSIGPGETFLPPAVTIRSFLRPVMDT